MDGHAFDRCDVQGNSDAHNVPFRVQAKNSSVLLVLTEKVGYYKLIDNDRTELK